MTGEKVIGVAAAAAFTPIVTACAAPVFAAQGELPPPLEGDSQLLSREEMLDFYQRAVDEARPFDWDDPEVIQYLRSVINHSLQVQGASEEFAEQAAFSISRDYAKNGFCGEHTVACVVTNQDNKARATERVLFTELFSNPAETWTWKTRYCMHEAGHLISQPGTQVGSDEEVYEDYGFAKYQIYRINGFNPQASLIEGVDLLKRPDDNGIIRTVPEEGYAEFATVHTTQALCFPFEATDFLTYGFSKQGIIDIFDPNLSSEPWVKVWHDAVPFEKFNQYVVEGDRQGLCEAVEEKIFEINTGVKVSSNYGRGMASLFLIDSLDPRLSNREITRRIMEDPLTDQDIQDAAQELLDSYHRVDGKPETE